MKITEKGEFFVENLEKFKNEYLKYIEENLPIYDKSKISLTMADSELQKFINWINKQ